MAENHARNHETSQFYWLYRVTVGYNNNIYESGEYLNRVLLFVPHTNVTNFQSSDGLVILEG